MNDNQTGGTTMNHRITRRTALLGGAGLAAASAGLAAPAYAQGTPIRLGGLATLEGPFATGGQDSFRCVQMELERINSTVGGRRIEFIRESSNAQADVALARARKLIEQDNVDIILGPLSGAEGIALRDYSRTLTGKTIVNGSSGASDTTLRNPSPNFFRFSTDGTQWMAGLGNHVYRTLNIREVAWPRATTPSPTRRSSASTSSSAVPAGGCSTTGRRSAPPTSRRRSRRSIARAPAPSSSCMAGRTGWPS
jgi:branched-chain amino acid transport system substrate-binding protein